MADNSSGNPNEHMATVVMYGASPPDVDIPWRPDVQPYTPIPSVPSDMLGVCETCHRHRRLDGTPCPFCMQEEIAALKKGTTVESLKENAALKSHVASLQSKNDALVKDNERLRNLLQESISNADKFILRARDLMNRLGK